MNVRELIADLNSMLAYNQDVGEFEVVAYDYRDEKWRPVTLAWSPQKKQITMHMDKP